MANTINLTDQVNSSTSVSLDYNTDSKDVKATVAYSINADTKVEVSEDTQGNTSANLTINF